MFMEPVDLKSSPDANETIELLGIHINTQRIEQVIDTIDRAIRSRRKSILAYVNVHAVNLAQKQPWFKDFLNNADVTYCDGYGIKWGAKILGFDIPQRYTPPDWFPRLCSVCAQNGHSLYFIGARPGVAEKAAKGLKEEFLDLKILGTDHGYFDKTPGCAENDAVIQAINSLKPDILVVGFGMPLQEKWLDDNWEQLDAWVALPVGALFDYLADEVPRAPRWLTDYGFEWLGRLLVEPRRLWRRYLVGNPKFLLDVIRQRLGTYPAE
jgi:N-acetylglucosaminyldiphosphoundecaprenol N-acetyl-beta-D-mannosaminyltransferase